MGVGTLSNPWSVTLAGMPLSVIADPDHPEQDQDPGYTSRFVTQDITKTLTLRDVPVNLNRFQSAGAIRRLSAADDGKLAWVENLISWNDNGLTLTGARTGKGVGLGITAGGAVLTGQAIIDSRPFAGDRYCITSGGYIIKFANDDPTDTVSFSPSIGTFAASPLQLHSGYVTTAIEVFKTSTGVPALFVAAHNDSVPATKIYKYTTAGGWTNTNEAAAAATFTTIRIDKLCAPVWWESKSDGAGAQRMLGSVTNISGGTPSATGFVSNIVRHVIEGFDPMAETSWVTPITTDPSAAITRLIAFPEFAFAITPNGIWTFNEIRSMNVTPFATLGSSYSDGRHAALWRNGVAWARGFGVSYYDATTAYRRQDETVEIGPGASFQDGTPIGGQCTGLIPFEQWLIQSIYNHSNQTTYIGRTDRDGRQFWAEHVLYPGSGTGQQMTHMAISSPTVAGGTVLPARAVNLWMFTADEPFSAGSNFNLFSAPLPTGAGPLSKQVSSGTFSYLTQATGIGRAYLTQQDWSDPLANKFVSRFDMVRFLQGKAMTVYTRTDLNPATVADQSTWTLAKGTFSDTEKITPSAPVAGQNIGLQLTLQTDNATIGPIFQSVSMRAKVVREQFDSLTLWVILERNHELNNGTADPRDPDDILAAVTALQDQGPQSYVDEEGTTRSVYVEQGSGLRRMKAEGYGWTTVLEVPLTLVA